MTCTEEYPHYQNIKIIRMANFFMLMHDHKSYIQRLIMSGRPRGREQTVSTIY